jgi:hypothetical protein
MTMPKPKRRRIPRSHEDEHFYESLPAAMGHQYYTPDAAEISPDEAEVEHDYTREARTTAIITLLLSLAIAVILGVLFVRGLDTIKNTVPPSDSAGTLEL